MRYFAVLAACLLLSWSHSMARSGLLEGLGRASYMEGRIVFGDGGGRELRLDLYRPARGGDGPYPAVVFIHGGGWRAGHPGHFSRQAMYLAANGYICACIEYRLSGEAVFPAAVEDCKCAVRWLRTEEARGWGVDGSRIGVCGASAGGHLALLLGASGDEQELEGGGGWAGNSSRVQCVAAFNPASRLIGFGHGAVAAFLGGSYGEVPEHYRLATPATWLDSSDPPMLLLHGTDDTTVPYSQSVEFVEQAREHGVRCSLYTEQGAGHSWFSFPPSFVPTTRVLKEFLDRHLKP